MIVIPSCNDLPIERVSITAEGSPAPLWAIVALDSYQRSDGYDVGVLPAGFATEVSLVDPLPDALVAEVRFVVNSTTPGPTATQTFKSSDLSQRLVWFEGRNQERSVLDDAGSSSLCDDGGLDWGLISLIAVPLIGGLSCIVVAIAAIVAAVRAAETRRKSRSTKPTIR
jgi:hypothetical protein